MKVITQHFIGTTHEWEAANPKLYKAVFGFETTTDGKLFIKLGNGVDRWKSLKYINAENIKGLPEKIQEIYESAILKTVEGFAKEINIIDETYRALKDSLNEETLLREKTYVDMFELKENTATEFLSVRDLIKETNDILDGTRVITLTGATLTRVINGTTEIQKNLFEFDTVFTTNRTIITDKIGTTGVFAADIDAAVILVITKSISPISDRETKLLGEVTTHVDLPLTVEQATVLFGRNPRIDDYAQVAVDETFNGKRVEWYIVDIDTDEIIFWDNPVVINTADYQTQTGAEDEGKILTGGTTPGTFGKSLSVETYPTENSNNLVSSGGNFAWFGAAVSTLKTTAKNIVGAINELFDSAVKLTGAQTISGVKTFSNILILPDTNPTNLNQAVRLGFINNCLSSYKVKNGSVKFRFSNANNNSYVAIKLTSGTESPGEPGARFYKLKISGVFERRADTTAVIVRTFSTEAIVRYVKKNTGNFSDFTISLFNTYTSGGTPNVRLAVQLIENTPTSTFQIYLILRNQAASGYNINMFQLEIEGISISEDSSGEGSATDPYSLSNFGGVSVSVPF